MLRKNMRFTKKALAIELSKIKGFLKPKVELEQYQTDSEIASVLLWDAYMRNDITQKIVADLGAGTGILGIGALLLGAKKVIFVEKDNDAITVLKQNIAEYNYKNYKIENLDIDKFTRKVDTIIMNPPFGVQKKYADRKFLEIAFKVGNKIYSFHKLETKKFIEKFCSEHNFEIIGIIPIRFGLKKHYNFHTKKIKNINIGLFIMEKK